MFLLPAKGVVLRNLPLVLSSLSLPHHAPSFSHETHAYFYTYTHTHAHLHTTHAHNARTRTHPGKEVALYCNVHIPELLLSSSAYKSGNIPFALQKTFLECDRLLTAPQAIEEMDKLLLNDRKDQYVMIALCY